MASNKKLGAASASNKRAKIGLGGTQHGALSSSSRSQAGEITAALPRIVQAFVSHDPSLIISKAANSKAALDSLIAFAADLTARAEQANADLASKVTSSAEADLAANLASGAIEGEGDKCSSCGEETKSEESCEGCAATVCRLCAASTFAHCKECQIKMCKDCTIVTPCGSVKLCEGCEDGYECYQCVDCAPHKYGLNEAGFWYRK
jgi:hypothetical protein